MPNRYTISILPSDQYMIYFVEENRKIQNFSAYVRDLIRRDMCNNPEILNLEQINKYVEKRLSEIGFAKVDKEPKGLNYFDDADKEVIKNLF